MKGAYAVKVMTSIFLSVTCVRNYITESELSSYNKRNEKKEQLWLTNQLF